MRLQQSTQWLGRIKPGLVLFTALAVLGCGDDNSRNFPSGNNDNIDEEGGLLGVIPSQPIAEVGLELDNNDSLSYDADYNGVSGRLVIEVTPTTMRFQDGGPITPFSDDPRLTLSLDVDPATGQVLSGDMRLMGTVTDTSTDTTYKNLLLSGEALEMGSVLNFGPTGSSFDFRFEPSEGTLQDFYLGQDIAVVIIVSGSEFADSYAQDFSASPNHNNLKGRLGPTRRP